METYLKENNWLPRIHKLMNRKERRKWLKKQGELASGKPRHLPPLEKKVMGEKINSGLKGQRRKALKRLKRKLAEASS